MIRQLTEIVQETRRLRDRCKSCLVRIHHCPPPATQWIITDSALQPFVTLLFTRLPWVQQAHGLTMWQFEDDSLAALCTYRQTLQQSRTFARRAFFLFSTQSLSVVTQTLDILFELIPAYRSH